MAFTKVVGPGIHTLSNILSHNINSSGIITATKFVGPFDDATIGGGTTITSDGINVTGIVTATGLDINGNGDISGNLVLGGDLTVNGTTTTLDTNLIGVDRVEVGAAGAVVGLAVTQSGSADLVRLYDGSTQVVTVDDEGNLTLSKNNPTISLSDSNNNPDYQIGNINGLLRFQDTTNNATRLGISTIGNVGINSSAPTSKLDVEGDVKISGITTTGSYFNAPSGYRTANHPVVTYASFNLGTGSYATRLGSTGTSTLRHTQIYAGGSHMATFDGNNTRLGIGKTNPDELLHIASTGTAKFRLTDNRTSISDGSQYGVIQFEQRDSNTPGVSVEVAALMTDTTNGATALQIKTGTPSTITERLRIDSSGRVILGGTASRDTRSGTSAYRGQLQMESNSEAALTMTRFGGTHPSRLNLQHARGTIDSIAAVQDDDDLGQISFSGWDGDTFTNAAEIRAEVDGTPGDDDMPGRLVFLTTRENGTDTQEALRIASDGIITGRGELRLTEGTTTVSDGAEIGSLMYLYPSNDNKNAKIVALSNGGSSGADLAFYTRTQGDGTNTDGGVERLRIKSDGKAVFQEEIETPQDYPNQKPVIDFNFAAVKKLDPRIKYYRSGPASYVNEFGRVVLVAENEPRFDHDPTTRKSKGLLIETTRTNFMKYSDEFAIDNGQTGGNWDAIGGESNYTRVSDTTETKDPTGITNHASKLTFVSGNPTLRGYWYSGAVNGAVTKTFSVYLKRATSNTTNIKIDIGDQGVTTYTITDEWKRYSVTTSSAGNGNFVDMRIQTGASTPYYAWGAQIEAGSYATSYIPTSSAAVIRGFDNVVVDGDDFTDFYNPVESSALAVGIMQRPAATQGQLNILNIGDSNNDGHGVFREHGTKDPWYHIRNNNSTPTGGNLNPSGFGDWDADEEARIAIAFKDGDQAISVNGGNQVTATVTTNYPTDNITKMWIGSAGGNGSGQFEGTISRIAYYPKKLTDNQLNTLTAS